jgi:SAM-dependent methyltransferase
LTQNTDRIEWWHVFADPAFIARSRLRFAVGELVDRLALAGRGTWLDLGCGSRPYESMFDVEHYVGLDVPVSGHPPVSKHHDLLFDGNNLPVRSGTIDGVLCTQVLEHTANPEGLLREIWRVLKPGGSLVMTAPFVWEEHEKPYDFFRFTEHGLRHLLDRGGFHVMAMRKTTGSIEALAQTCAIYVLNNLRLPIRGFGRAMTALVCAPIQIFGLVAQKFLPDERNLFLDHAVLARKDELRNPLPQQ